MKPLYLLLLFSTIFMIKVNAQHLEIGNKWIYDHRYHLGSGHYTEKIDSIEIVSDTIINNLNYFKLIASEDSPCGIFVEEEYLREEDGQIFRLSGDKLSENLMLDFNIPNSYNLNYEIAWQNDIIETIVENDSSGTEVLPDGSSILVNYQRIINNSSFDDATVYKLVDKIGYIQYGFLFPNIGTGLCDPEESQNLRCFISQNDTIHLTEFDCYESSIKVATKDLFTKEININPNPSSGIVYLPGDFDAAIVYDVTGKKMNIDIENSTIDFSALENGFYIVQLRKKKDRTVYTSKFIKI